jgi:hypothetical protein
MFSHYSLPPVQFFPSIVIMTISLTVIFSIRTFLEKFDGCFWLKVLHFADKWGFEVQKTYALTKLLEVGSPAEKIVAGRITVQKPEWFIKPFLEMSQQAVTFEDGKTLGLEDLVLLCQMQFYLKSDIFRGIKHAFRPEDYLLAVFVGKCKIDDVVGAYKWFQSWRKGHLS